MRTAQSSWLISIFLIQLVPEYLIRCGISRSNIGFAYYEHEIFQYVHIFTDPFFIAIFKLPKAAICFYVERSQKSYLFLIQKS